jgi:hypothetical protein
MAEPKVDIKPIRLLFSNVDQAEKEVTDHELLMNRFTDLGAAVNAAYRQKFGGLSGTADAIGLIAIVGDFLPVMQSLDKQFGADDSLPVDDAGKAADDALLCLTELETWLDRLELPDCRDALSCLQLGVAYWAMRHHLPIQIAEPVVNALAARSNAAQTRQETAAVYALMQGFIHHMAPALQADLEQSNPERPWRILNLNFAITAIRTGDAAMMRYAFDTLNRHLPDERAGFYEEAVALASQPGFPVETRAIIEAEYARWARMH